MSIPETLVKTFRHKLVSTSTTSTVETRHMAATILMWATDRQAPAFIYLRKFCLKNLSYELDRRVEVSGKLLEPEADYINLTHKGLCHKYMQGSAFVQNTLNGDVGVVFRIAHSISQAVSSSENCDLSFKHGINDHKNVFFHAQVILPNGNYTTWRITKLESLPVTLGITAFTETDF